MTKEQFAFAQDFSLRMARTCFRRRRRPNAQEIVDLVADFFGCVDELDVPYIVDHERSMPYPVGHPWYAIDRFGRARTPMLLCDHVREWSDSRSVRYSRRELRSIDAADRHHDYDRSDALQGEIREAWFTPVHCCIRAGIDAVTGQTGVLGFTAGDVRRMYPAGVPEQFAQDTWSLAFSDPPGDPKPFSALLDSQLIAL